LANTSIIGMLDNWQAVFIIVKWTLENIQKL